MENINISIYLLDTLIKLKRKARYGKNVLHIQIENSEANTNML